MTLQDKVAIVSGGSNGIGQAIAEAFAAQGAFVAITDVDEAAGQRVVEGMNGVARSGTPGRGEDRSMFLKTDVSSKDEVAAAVKTINDRCGRIDILVNNAAVIIPWHNIVEAPRDEWEICYQIALMGTANFTQAVLPLMIPRKSGSIVNISSVQGLVAGRNSPAYSSIKHALIGLTRSTACDFGPHNIRCNAICPGAIRTRISPPLGSELHQRQISKTFLGRTGEPHEVAAAAVFLASDASAYITGAAIPVDGGWTAM